MSTHKLLACMLITLGAIWVVKLPCAWRNLILGIKSRGAVNHPFFNRRTVSFEENPVVYVFSQFMSFVVLTMATVVGVTLIYLGILNL